MQDFKSLIVIGAPKAGTSTLARLLASHPAIFQGAIKEPRFFCDYSARCWTGPGSDAFAETIIADPDAYRNLFRDAPPGGWWLDASTDYLADSGARARLADWARTRQTRLICMLRDPVERAVSQYRHTLRDMLETETLRRALALEPERMRAGWQPLFWHARRSRYHADVTAYIEAFGEDLLLVDFDELHDQARLMARIFGFLGLTAPEQPLAEAPSRPLVKNRSHSYHSIRLQRLLESPGLRHAAAFVVPQPFRQRLRERIERANRARFEPNESDLRALHALLEDDIGACLADTRLPTRSWSLSRHLSERAPAATRPAVTRPAGSVTSGQDRP